MISKAQSIEQTRAWLVEVIKIERKVCGSLYQAYHRVASKAGSSFMKVRRIIGRSQSVQILGHEYANFKELYEAAVEKQRQEYEAAKADKVRLANLQGQLDALSQILVPEDCDAARVPRKGAADCSPRP